MARESAWVFPLLDTCIRLKELKRVRKRLAWTKYSCILSSLASNSPFTCPTTGLESENMFMDFPPNFSTIDIPSNRASYSTSLFVAEKPSLSDFSMVIPLGEIRMSSTQSPFDLLRCQHMLSNRWVLAERLCRPIFCLCLVSLPLLLVRVQQTQLPDPRGPSPSQRCEACI